MEILFWNIQNVLLDSIRNEDIDVLLILPLKELDTYFIQRHVV